MRMCVQRVLSASVDVEGVRISEIGKGLLVLLGVESGDENSFIKWCVNKVANLRIFPDEAGKMSLSAKDLGLQVIVVSQFTLAGNCDNGRRPDFTNAERPERAEKMYEGFISELQKELGEGNVFGGSFGADMKVALVNDGPVTIIIDKKQ